MDARSLSKYDLSKDILSQLPAYTLGSPSSVPISAGGVSAPVHFEALSGVDLTAMIVVPRFTPLDLSATGIDPELYEYSPVKVFAELQTLTVSSSRSVSAVRRLGENHVTAYVRGGRTIAGTMVFTSFNRDTFAEFYRINPDDPVSARDAPMHVDQIPEFNVVVQGMNEHGALATCGLIGVTLTNFGTTMSVHDLMIESTYTYVAKHFFPMVSNLREFKKMMIDQEIVRQTDAALSQKKIESIRASTGLPPVVKDDMPDPSLYGIDYYGGGLRGPSK